MYEASEEIYLHPADYDLEVAAHDPRDIPFWLDLLANENPQRVLEIGCGTGRLTIPLARAGAMRGYSVIGIDPVAEMIARAEEHAANEAATTRAALQFIPGDLFALDPDARYDVVLMPYGAAHHLHTLDEQIATWSAVRQRLAPGGLFVVDLGAPDLALLAEARDGTPRSTDLETTDAAGHSLRRSAATTYRVVEQRAMINYEYQAREPDGARRAYASPFAMHVYFPRELELLFRLTGFRVERLVGSYAGEPFADRSPLLIAMGRAE